MLRFTQDVHSLATGKVYRKGQRVPASFLVRPGMIGSLIEDIEPTPDYEAMTYQELGDLIEKRGLDYERSTEDRIDRLLEDDKGGNK